MANYYEGAEDRYRETGRYGRRGDFGGFRGERSRAPYDRGWDVGRENPSAGWSEDYDRGYGSRYFTGDEQGGGFAGGREVGRSYRPSYERDFGDMPSSERGYNRDYGRSYGSTGLSSRRRSSEREYEGTFRPPDYGRDFDTSRERTDRRESFAGDRDWFDRASDEVQSWFGDEGAERRRRFDKMREGTFRGRGPKGYRRSDERIREDINDRLTDHAHLDASDIEVSVKEGEVTLSGKVFDRSDKRLAEDVAESVTGVKNVQNNLRTDKSWDTDVTARPTSSAKAA